MRKTRLGKVMGEEVEIADLDDEGIYSEGGIDVLLDEDGLSPGEAAFMQGYEEADPLIQ